MDDFQKLELYTNSRREELLEEGRHTQLLEGFKGGYPRVREVLIASTVILLGLLAWWAW
ncbi:MAG: hypothetical protein HYZ49_03215 [Chloroflexi bacterium]|nr:hypothetical protein [Chloroflexota bacterium]